MRAIRPVTLGLILVALATASHGPVVFGKDKKQAPETFALLIGTCFNEQGFSLPGARVLVELVGLAEGRAKKRKWEMVSSPRGEFAVRLPVGPHRFRVTARKEGYKPTEKVVSFEADERQDIVLTLEAEASKR